MAFEMNEQSAHEMYREALLEGYLAGVRAALPDGAQVYYLSTSMTSGKRMNEAAALAGYSTTREFKNDPKAADLVKKVFDENVALSNERLLKLREDATRFIITPTTLDSKLFSQDDYAWFWRAIMEHLRPTVLISPDWEHSTGSRYEIKDALEFGCALEDLEGNVITADEANELMDSTPLVK